MFCTACGTKNAQDSNFCKQCGKILEHHANTVNETDYVRAMPEEEQMNALLENAYLHRSRGDLTGAITLAEEAIRLQPSNPTPHALLAQIALQKGDKARAIQEYERVVAISPSHIAERIKLEELREGRTAPPVVRGGQSSESSSAFNPLLVVAACAGLLAVGAVMGDQLKRSQAKESHNPAISTMGTTPQQQNTGAGAQTTQQPQNGAFNNGQANTGAGQLPAPNGTATNPNTTGTQIATGLGGQPQQQIISAPPFFPPVVITPPANNFGGTTYFPRPRGSSTVPPLPIARGMVEPTPSNATGERVHLEEPEPKYVVNVDVGKPTTTGNTVSNPAPANTNPNPVSNEARTAIEVANNHLARNDYKSAIKALQAALKNPGSQEGLVHQQIGYCYQKLGDKTSGRTHYEQAISAYETQSRQGIQKELAEDGIRACKKGMKLCE